MPRFLLSPQAEKSLSQISSYTLKNFGERQRKKYLSMLRKEMRAVAADPKKGRRRNDIKPGYLSVSVEKHHIYYRISDAHIEIMDVLHQSMEPNFHL